MTMIEPAHLNPVPPPITKDMDRHTKRMLNLAWKRRLKCARVFYSMPPSKKRFQPAPYVRAMM